jgi:hypothetical protein
MAGKARGATRVPKVPQASRDSLGLPANLVRKVRGAAKVSKVSKGLQAKSASKG